MPDQYNKLLGHTLKYPYLVGISTEAGNLGTGILISARFVLTCGHVLQDSTSAQVISHEGITSARVQKVDDSLDLALLELTRSISATKAEFSDSPLPLDAILLAVGVQETPGQPDELSVAEIELKYRNKNDADGKILDIQFEGGARPGYSGGPVVAEERGVLRCVGILRFGGHGASSSNAIGLASIQAFLADYIPKMPEDKLGRKGTITHQLLLVTAALLGVFIVCAIAKWLYVASSPRSEPPNGTVEKIAARQSVSGKNTPTDRAQLPSAQPPAESTDSKYIMPPHTTVGFDRADQGRPDVRVWVNTASNVYHCPQAQKYGKTLHGKYMSQADAQKKEIRPAYGKVCK
jgi:Trypsin-like peptidase domain